MEPPYPGYRHTLQALQTYMDLAKKDDGEQLPGIKETCCLGRRLSRRSTAYATARLVGDLPARRKCSGWIRLIYEGPLVDAVKNFQRRHGRDPNGQIDAQTLADLNVPLEPPRPTNAIDPGAMAVAAGLVFKIAHRGEHPRISFARL